MTWEMRPSGKPWVPQPAPRLINRGIQGGIFVLDQADTQWKSVLKLQSKCPDAPASESNDHFRTIYCQTTPGPLSTGGEDPITLGVVLRFRWGIGNGQMRTIFDVVPNGILHAAIVGESVEVDAATVQVFFDGAFTTELSQKSVDDPTPIQAHFPPTITIGVVQNQALALNQIQNPKRMFNVTTPGVMGPLFPRRVHIPAGAQSVTILADPNAVHAAQVVDSSESVGIDLPINTETPLTAGAWLIQLDSVPLGADSVAGVVFGLGD